jgi:hypothetical protein
MPSEECRLRGVSVQGDRLALRWLVLAVFLLSGLGSISPSRAEDHSVTLLAAGDIARCGTGGAYATAKLLDRLPGVILALGDLAYESGSSDEYRNCYEPTWGRHKARTWPAPGNHEYRTPGAQGYFTYWGERAGPSGRGFYRFDLGSWHLVALNSNADATDGSAQDRWLRRDLAATKARCILAFWHHPLFSSGPHGNNPKMELLYRRLYESGATLVLAGHDHLYERFAPQDPAARLDRDRGIRVFTAGTGGAQRYDVETVEPNSEFRDAENWGVLRLTLEPDAYQWDFIAVDGRVTDSGKGACVTRVDG